MFHPVVYSRHLTLLGWQETEAGNAKNPLLPRVSAGRTAQGQHVHLDALVWDKSILICMLTTVLNAWQPVQAYVCLSHGLLGLFLTVNLYLFVLLSVCKLPTACIIQMPCLNNPSSKSKVQSLISAGRERNYLPSLLNIVESKCIQ